MAPGLLTLDDLDLAGRRVLIRVDFNVPVDAGVIQDDARIRACLPTLRRLLAAPAAVILVSHLGRPRAGRRDDRHSLAPVAERVAALLGQEVPLLAELAEELPSLPPGAAVMLENIRFEPGETANDETLARRLASLCNIYVNDAFAVAHRAHASSHGIAAWAAAACAGPLLLAELQTMSQVLERPARPVTAIVGGAKVSTKLPVLENLVDRVDRLLVGGGIANTFLKASGADIGASLYEPDLVDAARNILARARDHGKEVPLPVDAVCAPSLAKDAPATTRPLEEIAPGDLIVDVGPGTIEINNRLILDAGTVLWNGPVGVFEMEQFAAGTAAVAAAVAANQGFSIAGGGDTLAAIARFGVAERISHISTGGGAFLELLAGTTLPAVAALQEAARAARQSPGRRRTA